MSDEAPKITIPPLRKKGRTLADVGADSLAAALFYRELVPGAEPPAQVEEPPPAPAASEEC